MCCGVFHRQRTIPLPNSCLGTGNRRKPNPVGRPFFPAFDRGISYFRQLGNHEVGRTLTFKVGSFDKGWQGLVAKGEENSWRVARRGDSTGIAYAGGTGDTDGSKPVNDGAWHHFVAITDSAKKDFGTAIYVDGVLAAKKTDAAVLGKNGKRMMIGNNPDNVGRSFKGQFDDVAVWNRVLTESEITALYGKGTGGTLGSIMWSLKVGLKAYWNFNGNFKDSTANKFDGTENGSSAIAFGSGKPGFGKSMVLDGIDQMVEITGGEPDDLSFQGASMSLAGWFKVGSFDKTWQALVAKGEGNNWRLHRRGGEGGLTFTGGNGGDTPTGADINDGNWHHFAAINDHDGSVHGAAGVYMFMDGQLYSKNDGEANLAANGKRVMFGENPDARNRYWNGEVDDVAIWDRPISAAEISSLYANGAGVPLGILFGSAPDADKDGMTVDYEAQYGFNSGDPTDAGKDFDKDGVSNLAEQAAGSNPTNTIAPVLLSATSDGSFTKVVLVFDDLESLDEASASNLANYSFSPALTVTAAALSKKTVTLTTSTQSAGATAYTVTVTGVKDLSKNVIDTKNKASFYSFILSNQGVLRISIWKGINGTPVQNLYDDPRYQAGTPDMIGTLYSFNSRDAIPTDSLENYGASIEGFITPTETGSYRFFDYSDDASQLFLSTDDKEANLVQIAEQTGCCTFFTEPDSALTSEPIALVTGKKYFVRLIYKEGGGGDYGQVAWRKEGDPTPAGSLKPIPGQFLSSASGLPGAAEGGFATQSPAPNAKGVSPAAGITIAHRDGKTAWTSANVSMKVDNVAVTPVIKKDGTVLTLTYKPALSASGATHSVELSHLDAGGKPTTTVWSYTSGTYNGVTKDSVASYPGLMLGAATFTADKLGHTAKAGDRAIDTVKGGPVAVYSDAFLAVANAATASDELSVSFWQKKHDTADSSAFTLDSPTAGNGRNFHAHAPWSNQNVYFDTVGCCDGTTQRITSDISTFGDYTTGDPRDNKWWTSNWHHWMFTKKGSAKNIFIDGKLFLSGDSTNPLKTDSQAFYMGSGSGGGEQSHGLIDDFAVFGKALTEADALALNSGTLPSALTGKGLIAFWNFNDVPVDAPKFTSIVRNANGSVTFTWIGAGKLQAASSLSGPWVDQTGATSPATVTVSQAAQFARIVQ
ncbi:MAG: hypothetical protein EXS25_01085 [Pedosphaera sp.]|nr:hypothetical protein [Pedosphaera sp.]